MASKKLLIIFIGTHSNGEDFAVKTLNNKGINFKLWKLFQVDNYNSNMNNSDVYWPTRWTDEELRNESLLAKYINTIIKPRFQPQWRFPLHYIGANRIFSSSQARDKIEKEFLIAGLKILDQTNSSIQPFGFLKLTGFGFGATVMSWRNVPNNTPICIWWGNPENPGGLGAWYPLMRRRRR